MNVYVVGDFCEGTTAIKSPHPTNCHYYIQCDGNQESGIPCQDNLCFGITQTDGCHHCYIAICPSGEYNVSAMKHVMVDK